MTPDIPTDKGRADYLEGEYRYMVAAVERLAKKHPTNGELNNLARIGRLAIRPLDTEKNAPPDLVVKCALLRDGNVTSLEVHRTARRIPISTNDGAA